MKLNNQDLYNFYKEKNINYLYHANTLGTSITYIQNNGILSRGSVEAQNLFQTPQSSDEKDKSVGVWDDVFIDSTDLHSYFNRQNHYGPILFEFLTELILDVNYEIWITKDNPINWGEDTPDEEKYFSDVNELKEKWDKIPRQRKMTTIRWNNTPILFEYLNKIIIDDPRVILYKETKNEIHLFNEFTKKLKVIITNNAHLSNKFITRECTSCFCRINYLKEVSSYDLKRFFIQTN